PPNFFVRKHTHSLVGVWGRLCRPRISSFASILTLWWGFGGGFAAPEFLRSQAYSLSGGGLGAALPPPNFFVRKHNHSLVGVWGRLCRPRTSSFASILTSWWGFGGGFAAPEFLLSVV